MTGGMQHVLLRCFQGYDCMHLCRYWESGSSIQSLHSLYLQIQSFYQTSNDKKSERELMLVDVYVGILRYFGLNLVQTGKLTLKLYERV